jgi:hypothetical protein
MAAPTTLNFVVQASMPSAGIPGTTEDGWEANRAEAVDASARLVLPFRRN